MNASSAAALWPDGPSFRSGGCFPLSTDSILLADFVSLSRAKKGIDLGCGSGILCLLLAEKHPGVHMTGIDISEEAIRTSLENLGVNGLSDRTEFLQCDITTLTPDKFGYFDFVITNPPYYSVESGHLSDTSGRKNARSETLCSLQDLCRCAGSLLQTGGKFFLVYKPERLNEVFRQMAQNRIEPKRVRLVEHHAGSVPGIVLVEGRKDGRPGIRFEPTLLLYKEDGREMTEEAKAIYHYPQEETDQ